MAFLEVYSGLGVGTVSKKMLELRKHKKAAEAAKKQAEWEAKTFEQPKKDYYFIDKPLGKATKVTMNNLNDLIDKYNEIQTSYFAYMQNGKFVQISHGDTQKAVDAMAEQFATEPIQVKIKVGDVYIPAEIPQVPVVPVPEPQLEPELVRAGPLPTPGIGVEPIPVQLPSAVPIPMYGVSTPGSAANKIAFPEVAPRAGNGVTTPIPGVTTAGLAIPQVHPMWYGILGFGLICLMFQGRR